LEPEGFSPYFWQTDCLPLMDFFREPENDRQKQKKAGMKAGLPQIAVASAQ
jgi:hypothetical protein